MLKDVLGKQEGFWVPCHGEGDKEGCDRCWRAGGGDTGPYCAGYEYKIANAPNVIERGREWLSWCGEWVLGPFPLDYQERVKYRARVWEAHMRMGLPLGQTGVLNENLLKE